LVRSAREYPLILPAQQFGSAAYLEPAHWPPWREAKQKLSDPPSILAPGGYVRRH
jgi:hypothetical protein